MGGPADVGDARVAGERSAWPNHNLRYPTGMRTFVMGDPQVSFAHLQQVLTHHQLLDDVGNIVDDAHLISVGDHFDYGTDNTREVAAQGLAILH